MSFLLPFLAPLASNVVGNLLGGIFGGRGISLRKKYLRGRAGRGLFNDTEKFIRGVIKPGGPRKIAAGRKYAQKRKRPMWR